MNIIFFMEANEHSSVLLNTLREKNFSCIHTINPDEIDQAGKQTNKVALIFFDSKMAYQYLKSNSWRDFTTYNILYLYKNPKITPEAQKKIDSINLHIYSEEKIINLVEDLEEFYLNNEKQTNDEIELDFTALHDLENQDD